MKSCIGIFGKLFGHKFKTLYYTRVKNVKMNFSEGKPQDYPVEYKSSTICTRCGEGK